MRASVRNKARHDYRALEQAEWQKLWGKETGVKSIAEFRKPREGELVWVVEWTRPNAYLTTIHTVGDFPSMWLPRGIKRFTAGINFRDTGQWYFWWFDDDKYGNKWILETPRAPSHGHYPPNILESQFAWDIATERWLLKLV